MTAGQGADLIQRVIAAKGDNAIVQVAAVVEFANAFDEKTLIGINALASQFYEWGYLGQPINKFNISVNPGNNLMPVDLGGGQVLAGHGFSPKPNAVRKRQLKDITVRDNQLLLVADQYTRWNRLFVEMQQVLRVILGAIVSDQRLTGVTLEYVDHFRTRDELKTFPVAEVLAESRFVVPNGLLGAQEWHSSHGYYADATGSGFNKHLENINVSLSAPEGVPTLQIISNHRYTELAADFQGDVLKTVLDCLQLAHEASKELMNSLLTEDAKKLISLNKP